MIGTVYKPPDTNVNMFNHHFKDILRQISNERKKCIIMADFNIDLGKTAWGRMITFVLFAQ